MSRTGHRIRHFISSLGGLLGDAGHWLIAGYYAIRLSTSGKDTAPTYKYCRHLDRVTFFRTQFQSYLAGDPERAERWKRRRLFVDDLPDPETFRGYPAGTLGRSYYEMCKSYKLEGLGELRRRRLETLPEERKGLELDALDAMTDPEDLYEWIVFRRNIFMTSTHDLCHLLTGTNTDIPGEALCARYQYKHLLVPQNWMNMRLSMMVQFVTLKWRRWRTLRAHFSVIDASSNYSELDFAHLWRRPLEDLRREIGLPAEGFMPGRELRDEIR